MEEKEAAHNLDGVKAAGGVAVALVGVLRAAAQCWPEPALQPFTEIWEGMPSASAAANGMGPGAAAPLDGRWLGMGTAQPAELPGPTPTLDGGHATGAAGVENRVWNFPGGGRQPALHERAAVLAAATKASGRGFTSGPAQPNVPMRPMVPMRPPALAAAAVAKASPWRPASVPGTPLPVRQLRQRVLMRAQLQTRWLPRPDSPARRRSACAALNIYPTWRLWHAAKWWLRKVG